ncbi:hypothetical protein [Vibrio sonorensis]|uniref:hypothetical protein n=1 Tax=Vibrio sonorensis TaxID=1004316 RepID=UPI0008D95E6F
MVFAADVPIEEDPCHSRQQEARLVDNAYHYLNTKFCQPALWFDGFFVEERADQDSRAGTIVRWYNDYSLTEGKGYEYSTKLKARLHLPGLTKRLKLVFESDEEESVGDLFPSTTDETENTLGLRYDWIYKARTSLNFRVTARPGIEARYRYSYPVSDNTVLQLTQKLYRKRSVNGSYTQIDVDYSVTPNVLFRWSNFGTYEDDISGWELGSGVTFYQYLSDKQALNYRASTSGTNRPYHHITQNHLSVTYRQNFLRKWLFYEVTPEYNWYREVYKDKWNEAKFTFRLEVLFENL